MAETAIQTRSSSSASVETISVVLATIAAIVLFALVRDAIEGFYRHVASGHGNLAVAPMAGCALYAGAFYRTRYDAFGHVLRATIRSSALGLLVFLLLEPPDFVFANPAAAAEQAYVSAAYWLAIALGVASIWRPSFLLPVGVYLLSTRALVETVSGFKMSTLDVQYMLDIAIFLGLFAPPLAMLSLTKERQIGVAFIAFGMHLGNYFWSAIAKITIGPDPWSWILHNPTQNLIAYSLENGALPIGAAPWLVNAAFEGIKAAVVPINAFIVLSQLLAIACIFRVTWLRFATLAYDALHAGIYLLGGLFFWPWVWSNISILVAIRGLKGRVPINAAVACLVTILLGYPSLGLVKSAWLGWFDVLNARQTYFEAVTKDGRTAKVPSSFFLGSSHSVAHGQTATVETDGQLSFQWWGSGTYRRFLLDGDCSIPPHDANHYGPFETNDQRSLRLGKVAAFVEANHRRMLDFEDTWGRNAFYFRSHHIPSNPLLYHDFNSMLLSDVVGYNLVVSSTCHGLEDGHSANTVISSDRKFFPVR